MAARYWRIGMDEMYRDFIKAAFVRALQRYMPELQSGDVVPGPAGVRAQAVAADGSLVDDFLVYADGEHDPRPQRALARRHLLARDRPPDRRPGGRVVRGVADGVTRVASCELRVVG